MAYIHHLEKQLLALMNSNNQLTLAVHNNLKKDEAIIMRLRHLLREAKYNLENQEYTNRILQENSVA